MIELGVFALMIVAFVVCLLLMRKRGADASATRV
jgi:hypothetical protein